MATENPAISDDGRRVRALVVASCLALTVAVAPPVAAVEAAPTAGAGFLDGRAGAQTITVPTDAESSAVDRDGYSVTAYVPPPPPPPPEPVARPDPGTAKAIALEMVSARGWGDDQFSCLIALWSRESGWRVNAENEASGAYGIPQSLPGEKMATAGTDWKTNPTTQITWGIRYIASRYGDPCGAWAHSEAVNWY